MGALGDGPVGRPEPLGSSVLGHVCDNERCGRTNP
jgi:hypothetical protein